MTNHFLSPRSFARAAILAFLCLVSSATEAITSPVGSTPGSFAVSPSGAASYTIPIAVPPGTAGMEPKLALTYNSQGGNGLLGMGWSLSGLSAIHRCAATIVQDGYRGGINYNKYDRYCLDGKRLVRTDGYSEPKPGAGSGLVTHAGVIFGTYITEYSLETDPSIRVVATAYDSLRIPVHFSVYTKSGQILEFGVTPDSRIETQGKISISVWALNKVQDTVGNYLTVTYLEDNANGQYYPTRIDYTGNASKGLTPYNSVQFTYEARPDITPMYHAGSLKQSTVRLKNVQAYSGAGLVKDYRLAYDVSATTSRSRLIGLTECAGDGVCLPSTVIGHGSDPAASSFTDGSAWRTGWCGVGLESEFGAADFNADGKTDIWCHAWATGTTYVALSNGAGAFTGGSVWHSNWCIAGNIFLKPKIEIGDFNGDSKADLACSRQGVGSVTPILSNGVSAFLDDGVFYSDGFPSIGAADFNGDGTGDFFTHGGVSGGVYLGNSRIALSNTVGAFSDSTVWRSGWCPAEGGSYAGPGDFNGDGKADIWCRDPGTGDISVVLSDGISTLTNGNNGLVWKPGWCGQSSQFGTGDFNGDGKADIFCHDPGAASTSVGLSDGIGKFVDGGVWKAGWCGSGSFFGTGDFNGDGKTDIYCQDSVGSIYIALSNGAGAFPYGNAWRANWCAGTSIVPGDFNGDGKTDMACRVPSGNTSVALSGSMATPPDLLATITTGLGAVTTITYKPLTDNSVYIKEPGSNYPTLDIQAPLYVVSTSSTSNGIGGTRNTNYRALL